MTFDTKRGSSSVRGAGRYLTAVAAAFVLHTAAHAGIDMPEANIVQSRGVDQTVDYRSLSKYGLWDDRNYQLTKDDLAYLSDSEDKLTNKIPAFFRVELRKEWPHLPRSGAVQYPRAAWQLFRLRHTGFLRGGEYYGPRWGVDRFAEERQVSNELQLNQVLGANEITVEINHTNADNIIAGSNNNGGQEMYYSQDGGDTWTIQGTLPATCCDPTVGWSSDGSVAYVAALSSPSIGVSFWRSFDQGVTWQDRVDITSGGSDKEWLHVDISDSSPYQDSIYLTYHNGNVMQFARSTNGGTTFDVTAFPGDPSGIGSDITTTNNGDIYQFYGAFGTRTIEMLKSTDGGDTWAPAFTVASTNASFDWPIPSMDTRNAWIYAAADADRSGGTFDGSVYVAWTDTIAPDNDFDENANNTVVNVAYSRDGGASWTVTNPHSTTDTLTVDRYNQWLTVDEFGNVHVVFYDTRNSANRTGVDLYYSTSQDGGQTWSDPERVSTATSPSLTDGQEWGDYNGISVVGEKIIMTWTDNRDGPPNAKDVYAGELLNTGAAPGFTLGAQSAATTSQEVCAPGSLDPIAVDVGQIQGFTDPVTLSYGGLPSGFVGNFTVNPVAPLGSSTANVTVGAAAVAGDFSFTIDGSAAGASNRSLGIDVTVATGTPAAGTLVSPANGATEVSTSVTFSWNAVAQATSYLVEVDDDPAFGSVDFSTSTSATSATLPGSLDTQTTYYWRVTASNGCGAGAVSASNSFTTGAEICRTDLSLSIPDGSGSFVGDTANVSTSGEIVSLDVSIGATHTWVGDLIFRLTNQTTGTSVTLIDRPGYTGTGFGCSSDNIDAIMSDSSSTPVETTCGSAPALGGILQPQEPLAAFAGEDIGGSWVMEVSDNAGFDTGALNEWCLLPVLNVDSDGDGIADSADNCTLIANPGQQDSNGDGYGNACDADLNNDGIVNTVDLGLFKLVFFTADADADFNSDGIVNPVDLGILKLLFLQPPGPSGVAP